MNNTYKNNFSINIKYKNNTTKSDIANKCLSEYILNHDDSVCVVLTSIDLDIDADLLSEASKVVTPLYKTLQHSNLFVDKHFVTMHQNPEYSIEEVTNKNISFYPNEVTKITYTFDGYDILETSLYITETQTITH